MLDSRYSVCERFPKTFNIPPSRPVTDGTTDLNGRWRYIPVGLGKLLKKKQIPKGIARKCGGIISLGVDWSDCTVDYPECLKCTIVGFLVPVIIPNIEDKASYVVSGLHGRMGTYKLEGLLLRRGTACERCCRETTHRKRPGVISLR